MSGEHSDPSALVAGVLTAAEPGRDSVPALLNLLDVGDSQVRLGAAAALCVVADADAEVVPSLVRPLYDRAADCLAADLALAYLGAEFTETVAEELDDVDEDDEDRRLALSRSGPTRRGQRNRDIGRTRVASGAGATGPGRVHTEDDDEPDGPRAREDEDDDGTMGGTERGILSVNEAEWLSLVEYESQFDSLSVLAPRDRRRYGDTYRTLGITDDTERGVGLHLLDAPEESQRAFVDALNTRLSDWAAVSDIDNVLSLYDWNHKPRPWTATEYTDQSLAERGRLEPEAAVRQAEHLARAVATLHEQGVVHAGIDPGNVAYYGNVLEEDARQPPLLNNVGLMHVYRRFGRPSDHLDPRYAAPEYYDREFGRVDHATDIYQLGAVCYRLFTGHAPFAGGFDAVRESVLGDDTPTPSDVADVPPPVDDIVGKAMATGKLTRYETAAHLAQELRALREPSTDDGG